MRASLLLNWAVSLKNFQVLSSSSNPLHEKAAQFYPVQIIRQSKTKRQGMELGFGRLEGDWRRGSHREVFLEEVIPQHDGQLRDGSGEWVGGCSIPWSAVSRDTDVAHELPILPYVSLK